MLSISLQICHIRCFAKSQAEWCAERLTRVTTYVVLCIQKAENLKKVKIWHTLFCQIHHPSCADSKNANLIYLTRDIFWVKIAILALIRIFGLISLSHVKSCADSKNVNLIYLTRDIFDISAIFGSILLFWVTHDSTWTDHAWLDVDLEMIGCRLLNNLLSGGFYLSHVLQFPKVSLMPCWLSLLWSRFVCGQILRTIAQYPWLALCAISWSTHGDKQLERAPIWISTKVAMWAATLRIHLLLWDLKMISNAKPLIECLLLTCRI